MMRLFRKKCLDFRIIHIGDWAYDYPKDMPIPKIGELIYLEDNRGFRCGRVVDVHIAVHMGLHSIDVYAERI